MKVLQINSFFTVGGPPRILNGIYDTLIEEGHECKIAAAREKMYKPEDSIRIGTAYGVYLNAIQCRLFDNEGLAAKKATGKLVQQIKEYNPDVIHLHNLHGYYINIEILFDYLKSCGKPIFWTLHDCWAFTGHCSHFSILKCEQWKGHCSYCKQTRTYPNCYTVGRTSRNFRRKKAAFTGVPNMTIVTPSRWLAELAGQGFLGEYPVKVINNGVDLEKFHPVQSNFRSKYGLEGKTVLMGIAQVWGERKGYYDFFELADMLGDQYQVVLVGLSEKQKNEIPGNILGFTRTNSVEELVEIYSAADIFVNLTYEDNFPTVNIEALACGTPIITYDTGGSPEIADAENEIVCEQGDLKAVVRGIEEIRNAPMDQQRLVNNAARYSRQNMTDAYISMYLSNTPQNIRGGEAQPLAYNTCVGLTASYQEVLAA